MVFLSSSSFIYPQGSNHQESFSLNPQLQEDLSAIEVPLIYTQPRHHQPPALLQNSPQERMMDFFFTLAACNTVVVAKHPHHDQVSTSSRTYKEYLEGVAMFCNKLFCQWER